MPRGRKKKVLVPAIGELETVLEEAPKVCETLSVDISPLSIDYQSEQLNDMARKINEVITKVNAL